jgi:hypothetical protein
MTDVLLDDRDGTYITLDSRVLKSQASDFLLDSPQRHRPDRPGLRRALVHDQNDGLTINFNRDYPGGVTINDVVKMTNRFNGISVDNVKEIRGYSLAAADASGSSGGSSSATPASATQTTPSLTIRGNIMVDLNPEQRYSEPVNLQNVVQQLQSSIDTLTKRIAQLESGQRSPRNG